MNSQLETFRSLHAMIEICKEQMHDDLVDGARGVKLLSFIFIVYRLSFHFDIINT